VGRTQGGTMSDENVVHSDDGNVNEPEQKVVPQEEFLHVKNDMHRYKERNKQLEDELKAFQRAQEQAAIAQQEEQGRYKEVAEHWQKKAEENESKLNQFQSSWKEAEKMKAIREAAHEMGIRKEALSDLELLPTDSVIMEMTDQGRYNVLGAKDFVENLKASRGHWFTDTTPPNVNYNTPSGHFNDRELSGPELVKLQRENPAEYRKHIERLRMRKR